MGILKGLDSNSTLWIVHLNDFIMNEIPMVWLESPGEMGGGGGT